MIERKYVSYSMCFKPKEETKLFLEHLTFLLRIKTTKSLRITGNTIQSNSSREAGGVGFF